MIRRALLAAAIAFVLAGCGVFKSPTKENIEPPAELTDISPTVAIDAIWSHDLGEGSGDAGLRLRPAYGEDRIYASDIDGGVYAFDAASGRELWHVELGEQVGSGPGYGAGLVAVGGLDGLVIALDPESGSELWRTEVPAEVIAAPAVDGGMVVVRGQDGRVFGFSATDGSRRWIFDRGVPLLTLRGNSAPLISGDTVYVGYDNGKTVALALDTGALKWEQAVAQSEGRTELERLVDIDGEMGGTASEIFATTYRGQVGALATDTGRQGWSREMSSYGGLALSGDTLYLTDADGSVWALDARSGASMWQQDALAHRWLSSPAVAGGYVVVGDFEGYVHVLSPEDGSIAARTRVGDDPIRATPLAVGDTVYVANSDGTLAAIRVGG
jgi:outer membrane protein assembly factor BamB